MASTFPKLLPILMLLLIPVAPLLLNSPPPAYSVNPAASADAATIQVCRIDVTPCQREVNLPVGEEVTLGLYLDTTEELNLPEAHSLVAWEFHFQLISTARVEVVPTGSAGGPVQERGNPAPVLDGLNRLSSNAGQVAAAGRYYRVQNSYDSNTGQIDFSVTLVGFSRENRSANTIAITPGSRLLLGMITLSGVAPGSAELVAADSSPTAFQVVTVTESGAESTRLTPLVAGAGSPLAVVNVGPAAEKARLEGLVWQQTPVGAEKRPFERQFTLTFWKTGAVPSWLGGDAEPVAAFANLTADRKAEFTVTDISEELLPSGVYDLRVNGVGALSDLVSDVTIDTSGEAPGSLPVTVSVDFGIMRSGDLNGDNVVDSADLSALKSSFGDVKGNAAFNPTADLNADRVVDVQDFSLLTANLNGVGE